MFIYTFKFIKNLQKKEQKYEQKPCEQRLTLRFDIDLQRMRDHEGYAYFTPHPSVWIQFPLLCGFFMIEKLLNKMPFILSQPFY